MPEAPPAAAARALAREVARDLNAGTVEVAGMPEIVARVRSLLATPRVTARRVAQAVQADPALAARLMRIAHSAFYRRGSPARDLRAAVCLLGLESTRRLVTAFAVGQVFRSRHPAVQDLYRTLWRRSTRVAAMASILARPVPGVDPEQALLGGLVHEIGAIPLLQRAERYPALVAERPLLERLLAGLGPRLGRAVLVRWGFDEDLCRLPEAVGNMEFEPDAPAGVVDVVVVARLHRDLAPGTGPGEEVLDRCASWRKLGLSRLGPGASVELLALAEQEVAELVRILGGARTPVRPGAG